MAQLAIKGHKSRGNEVIEILEMLGGKNRYHFKGDEDEWFVLNGNIQRTDRLFAEKGFTLEEFLEKYPYKVGDKVLYKHDNKIFFIRKMFWENDKILYELSDEVYSGGCSIPDTIIFDVVKLQPYKEEPMDGELTCDETLYLKVSSLKSEKTQIVFSADAPNETELVLGDNFEVKVEDGKTYVVRKQSKYPKTYEECFNICFGDKYHIAQVVGLDGLGNNKELFENFIKLKICRDAYWKIAGDWQPDVMYGDLYCIGYDGNVVTWKMQGGCRLLAFPTEEMRDAFYENFKELIELVKELL